MYTFAETQKGYRNMWAKAQVTKKALSATEAKAILKDKARYLEVEAATHTPWFMVAALHYREGDRNFNTYLGNGQNLHHVTTIVPAGRGPFKDFLEGAIDALKYEGVTGITDWETDRMLYWSERFNGQGYFGHGNSPYVWAGTNLYSGGLFTSDHNYDPSAHDNRLGVAAIFKALGEIDAETAERLKIKTALPNTGDITVQPQAPHIDLGQIAGALEAAEVFMPMALSFFPALAPLGALIPIARQLISGAQELQSSNKPYQKVLAAHLRQLADQIEGVKL